MKRFFTKNGILLLSAVTIVAVVLCVVSALTTGTGLLHNALGVIVSPIRSGAAAVSGWVQSVGDRFQRVEELQQENEALRRENARLQEALRQAETDSQENQRLRNLLHLRQQERELTLESAFVTARSASNWTSTLTLNKGTSADVAIGNCVVDEYGYLVGIVTDAGLNWCTVTTVLDTETRLGASVFRTGDAVIVEGDLALMGRGLVQVLFLEEDIRSGDLIVTSGLGGYFPPDLVIGTVENVYPSDSGMGSRAQVAPRSELDELTEVFVITAFSVVE